MSTTKNVIIQNSSHTIHAGTVIGKAKIAARRHTRGSRVMSKAKTRLLQYQNQESRRADISAPFLKRPAPKL